MQAAESGKRYQIGTTTCKVYVRAEDAARRVAEDIAGLIRRNTETGKVTVLGLATGSSPVLVYRELIRMHRDEGLSFKTVHSFNLDEYYGLASDHPESYGRYMKAQLFDYIDIPIEQTHLPNGTEDRENLIRSCQEYEAMISELGGLDFQLLGIGQTGHIGFNEPGSSRESRTRLITLDQVTRMDAARDFVGLENVPRYAITMGVGTILEAREIALIAWGKAKANIVQKALEGNPTQEVSASLLQGHTGLQVYLNESAATELSAVRYPWTTGQASWSESLIKQAVHGVALREKKPILKLVDRDYQLYGLEELLSLKGKAYDLNIRIFNETQATITGWPGGKPGVDDRRRPVPSEPKKKKILVLCSEPGAESICLGATLNRLQRQGHEVRLVFHTSGDKAVKDSTLNRFHCLLELLEQSDGPFSPSLKNIASSGRAKKLLRKNESLLASTQLGLMDSPTFLNLPFYDKGAYRAFQPQNEDFNLLLDYLNHFRPDQIYTSGKMADPSSLEGVCWNLFEESREKWGKWSEACQVWLFRECGAFWESHEIDMAVPVSPDEREVKEAAVREYSTDLSLAVADGAQTVASYYDALGLPEYEEIEAFQLYKPALKS